MERSTKRFLSTALFVPVLSLTAMQIPSVHAQQNPNFLERVIGGNKSQNVAQASPQIDTRTIQLEQALRDLTTQVENLNVQILEMQNRIDVLEGKKPSNAAIAQRQQLPINPPIATTSANSVSTNSTVSGSTSNKNTTPNAKAHAEVAPNTNGGMENLGSIHFDRDGNIIESASGSNSQASVPTGGNQTSSVPQTSSPKELYQIGYQSILAGDYRAAEPIFRAFQERYPSDPLIADASFWLGESLYGQGRYREAAAAYMDVERNYNSTPRAPENMLKLGMTMAELNDDETACAVFAKVPQEYKQAEPAVLKRVVDEQKRLNCSP